MVTRSTRETLLSVGGSLALVGGAYLRWTRRSDDVVVAFTPRMAVDNMHAGFAFGGFTYDVMVVAAAVLAVVALGFTNRNDLRTGATLLSGVVPVVVCVQFLRTDVVSFFGDWVPGVGWYLTLLGGVVLVANGALLALGRFATPVGDRTSTN